MRSLKPSTWVRSRRPLSKARRVNSPRSAGRQNGKNDIALRTEDIMARPECTCSSSTSSVVNDLGPYAAHTLDRPCWRQKTTLLTLEVYGKTVIQHLARPWMHDAAAVHSPRLGLAFPSFALPFGARPYHTSPHLQRIRTRHANDSDACLTRRGREGVDCSLLRVRQCELRAFEVAADVRRILAGSGRRVRN